MYDGVSWCVIFFYNFVVSSSSSPASLRYIFHYFCYDCSCCCCYCTNQHQKTCSLHKFGFCFISPCKSSDSFLQLQLKKITWHNKSDGSEFIWIFLRFETQTNTRTHRHTHTHIHNEEKKKNWNAENYRMAHWWCALHLTIAFIQQTKLSMCRQSVMNLLHPSLYC